MTVIGILENIVADIFVLVLGIVLPLLIITVTKRRKLQRFFNVQKTKRIVTYISNLGVLPFGSTGISGQKMSFTGEAVASEEMQAANQINDLFNFAIPKLTKVSKTVGRLLFSDVKADLLVSPLDKSELEQQTSYIAFGSPAYNIASSNIEGLNLGVVKFRIGSLRLSEVDKNPSGFSPIAGSDTDPGIYDRSTFKSIPTLTSGSADIYDPSNYTHLNSNSPLPERIETAILVENIPPFTDTTYGFVQRVIDPEQNRAIFYVAGLSQYSTKGAGYYLASQWHSLYKKYKDKKQFIVMLRFDALDFNKWSVVFEQESSRK